jgi:hypothetical protein
MEEQRQTEKAVIALGRPGVCPQADRLQIEVQTILQKLTELTTAKLLALQQRDNAWFMRLDRELEVTVGERERLIGSLREHVREHGCDRQHESNKQTDEDGGRQPQDKSRHDHPPGNPHFQ